MNPFFAIETHPLTATPHQPWRLMQELVDDPPALADRVHAVRTHLGPVEQRVAASVTHLGLVARLISPALAAAATNSPIPDLDLHHTWWQPVLGTPFPLSAADTTASLDQLLDGPIRTLTAVTQGVSDKILWGNVASALHGAAAIIGEHTAVEQLMTRPPLRDTGSIINGKFRRRTCCLIYRATPRRFCGDCVLIKPSS